MEALKLKTAEHPRRSKAGLAAHLLGVVAAVSTFVSAPAWADDAQTIAANVCVACHGADGNSLVPMFPNLAGLQESYIAKQLHDFMSGRRKNDMMAPIIATLKPEDVAPLAAYFASQKMKQGEPDDKKQVGFGKMVFFDGNEESGVPACVGCHQPKGAGHNIYPRIGGQQAQYIVQQLKNFASGERSNDVSRFMRVTAKRMTEEEIDAVAQYLVGLDGK
jgi:cytochrome c553